MITFRCSCGKQLHVEEAHAGSNVKCPECEEILCVPGASAITDKPISPKTRPMEDDEGIEDRPRRSVARYARDDRHRDYRRPQKSGGNGLLIGLIVGGVLLLAGIGTALFFLLKSERDTAVARVRQAAVKTQLTNNMKQITLALHSFHDQYKRLPAPGFSKDPAAKDTKSLLSWRVAILPYIEQGNLYRLFKLDEPWDSPHNIKLLDTVVPVYEPLGAQLKKPGHTYLQLVTGPGTAYPTPTSFAKIPFSFPDGTSNTILIVEGADPVPWTKPADFHIDVTKVREGNVPKLGALLPNGFYAGLGDGSVRFIDRGGVSDRTIRMAFNPTDGNVMGPDW